MDEPEFFIKRANLPHWRMKGAIYFLTWRIHRLQTILNEEERELVCRSLRHFDGQRYLLGAYVVMDDHVHVLTCCLPPFSLDQIVRSWRSFTANQLQRAGGRTGEVWQTEPFDRVVRDKREAQQKINYIMTNPFKRWPNLTRYPFMGSGELDCL